jgi:hypothetical protein
VVVVVVVVVVGGGGVQEEEEENNPTVSVLNFLHLRVSSWGGEAILITGHGGPRIVRCWGLTFSRQSALRWQWGCQPLPPGRFLVLISVRGWVDPRATVQLEELGQLKNPMTSLESNPKIPACNIVPQPSTLPYAPKVFLRLTLKSTVF